MFIMKMAPLFQLSHVKSDLCIEVILTIQGSELGSSARGANRNSMCHSKKFELAETTKLGIKPPTLCFKPTCY